MGPEPACQTAADCPGSAACADVRCRDGACVVESWSEYTACNDGDPCTANDRCVAGSCVGDACAPPLVCDPAGGGCVLDQDPPVLAVGSFSLAGGATSTTTLRNTVALSGSDALSPITHFCLKHGDSSAPAGSVDPACTPVDSDPPGLTPATTFDLAAEHGYLVTLGMLPGAYSVYAWLVDAAGNVSVLTGAGNGTLGQDRWDIVYDPGHVPALAHILAASSDAPSAPPSRADLVVAQGADVYVKWLATDAEGLAVAPISLSYTLDDQVYAPIASGLPNDATGGCLVNNPATAADDRASGCYLWRGGAPTDQYFRIRVAAQDDNDQVAMALSLPLNAPSIRLLAGNTYPGTGSSARAAMFFADTLGDARVGDLGCFVVTRSGHILFRDLHRGILDVDPADGLQRVLVPTTGASSGDGGPVTSATLTLPLMMTLDGNDMLYVMDYDRIRRIDTAAEPMTIHHLVGGGLDTSDTVLDPAQVRIDLVGELSLDSYVLAHWGTSFFALRNGDLYFFSEDTGPAAGLDQPGGRVRVYRAASGRVESVRPWGLGCDDSGGEDYSAVDITRCDLNNFALAYDPLTGAVTHMQISARTNSNIFECPLTANEEARFANLDLATFESTPPHPPQVGNSQDNTHCQATVGLDGRLYRSVRDRGQILRYNAAANAWDVVVGTGLVGSCPDGTPALSCNIDPQYAFIDAQGHLYFADKGRVRTVDGTGSVQTVVGRPFFDGDGGHPLDARFHVVDTMDRDSGGEIVVLDKIERRFRAFYPEVAAPVISTIAGNGTAQYLRDDSDALARGIATAIWYDVDGFAIDPVSRDLFFSSTGDEGMYRLDRASSRWYHLVGHNWDNCTYYYEADGLSSSDCIRFDLPPAILGFDGRRILAASSRIENAVSRDAFVKTYDVTDLGRQAPLLGALGIDVRTLCSDGTALDACQGIHVGYRGYARATYDDDGGAPRWLLLVEGNRRVKTASADGTGTLESWNISDFGHGAVAFAYDHTADVVYYCSESGRLFSYDPAGPTEVALDWPIASIACAGKTLLFVPGSPDRLVFIYRQGGLSGIAEFLLD